MVDRDGLENRCACKRTVGSNPTLSANRLAFNQSRPQLSATKRRCRGNTLQTVLLTALAVIGPDFPSENEFLSGRVDRGAFGTLKRKRPFSMA